ncbi:MAG: glycosyltransferase family 2 protein [Phycisphaerales bacterium]|nr:glycosyltransferase family 2 protein [Phycisphaerales bacterium]
MTEACIIVVPVFNEAASIDQLLQRTAAVSPGGWTMVVVDDGSSDETIERLSAEAAHIDPAKMQIQLIQLSRNFGHQRALMAGLDVALRLADERDVDRIAIIDADLQDRPEDIPDLLEATAECDVAYAVRASRRESALFQMAASVFYRLLARWARSPVPPNAGTFSVLNLPAATAILRNADENVFFPGLRAWVGFKQIAVPLQRDARGDGHSRVGIKGLVRLAVGALFGYSRLPLYLMMCISATALVLSVVATIVMSILKLTGQVAVEGIPLLVVLIFFSLSVLAVFLTILAYMVSRNPAPVQSRELYVIAHETSLN